MTPKIAFAVAVMVAMLVAMVAADGKKEDKYAKNHPHRYHKEFLGTLLYHYVNVSVVMKVSQKKTILC